MFSLGVILYEFCTGQPLFLQNLCTDAIVQKADRQRLCLWLDPDPEMLEQTVFREGEATSLERMHAVHLTRWLLQGDASLRPDIRQVLQHPFLNADGAMQPLARRYHAFISHMQIEASGHVGTMFFNFLQLGCCCWRDMNQEDLTEEGMRNGVLASDVFILILTNSVLSRPFCLKEIGWALAAGKPTIIVVETDERFWPFSYERWKSDELKRDPSTQRWEKAQDLPFKYADCPENIKALIESHVQEGLLIPYRRRGFESDFMMSEILRRVGQHGLAWGVDPSLPATQIKTINQAMVSLAEIRVGLIFCPEHAGSIVSELSESVAEMQAKGVLLSLTTELSDATHVLIILSAGLLASGSESLEQLATQVRERTGLREKELVYLYCSEAGWIFNGAEQRSSHPIVNDSINSHEALVYRYKSPTAQL
jgi:hypothetical protein